LPSSRFFATIGCMIILSCNNITLSFGTNKILENISFNVQDSDRIGVVGVNGAGKSTLFKIIAGILQPDSGELFISKGLTIGYLAQNTGLSSSNSIWSEMLSVYSHLMEMEKRIKLLEKDISMEKDVQKLNSMMNEYSLLTEKYSTSGGFEYISRIRGVLKGLGFSEDQFERKIDTLSGGQKTRLALAKLLLQSPDILLLDEPTNHLDIDATEWLEDFLKNYRKCFLVISHDRYFLDVTTTKTLELENCHGKLYNVSYSGYVKQKSEDRKILQKHYELQQKEIARLEAFIEQQRRWNRERNIKAAESRQKAIDRMEKIEKPSPLPGKIRIKLRTGIVSGNDVLFVENLKKDYPGKQVFDNISFNIKKNEKVFLLGPNGCGKSTLLKILAGMLDETSGSVEYGHNVIPGYYDQEQKDLDENSTIIEEVWKAKEKLTQTEIRNTLAAFLFKGEDVFKPISVLSGGERSRVSLAKLMLSGANFLLLDEPTNHLDINSREALEDALQEFDGTLLVVSHDRYLINKLATRILVMDGKGSSLEDFAGGYSQYQEYKNTQKKEQDTSSENSMSRSKLEHLLSKEEKSRQRRLEKRLNQTENDIELTESRMKEIESEMTKEEVCSDHVKLLELQQEYDRLKDRLERLYRDWEELMSAREG